MSEAKGFLTLSEAAMKAVDENGLVSCPVPTDSKSYIYRTNDGDWIAGCTIKRNGVHIGKIFVCAETREAAIARWNER